MSERRLGAAMDIRFGATVADFFEYVTDLGLNHVEFKREYLAGHPDTPDPERVRVLASKYDVSVTYHAPFRDWNVGSYDDQVRRDSVKRVKQTLDDAAAAGAGAVVVHGGSVPHRYPEWVREKSRENAMRSLAECAEYAQFVGVPLCLENQPIDESTRRYTTTPEDLERLLETVDVTAEYLKVTLDVGHAKVNGENWREFVDRFGQRIGVCHLHDNDGTADQHDPLTEYEPFVDEIPADYFVFETKSLADVARSVGADTTSVERRVPSDD
jgi:sugar phosphate isomerase/epimerase